MPRQGQSVESCIITEWQKKEGDTVSEGDILFSYETDKSSFEEPSQLSGVILKILANNGDVVPCLDPVCVIGEKGENWESVMPQGNNTTTASTENKQEAEAAKDDQKTIAAVATASSESNATGRIMISPRAKNLALKCGVDMTMVTPTGPHGRIIERDITAALDAGYRKNPDFVRAYLNGEAIVPTEASTPVPEAPAPKAAEVAACSDDLRAYSEAPLSNVRKVIARSMHASLSEMAQLTLNSTFDASAILSYREKLKAGSEALGLGKITINDIIVYAVSRTLLDFPQINSNLVDNTMRTFKHANIGVAVDTDRGLLVPVVFGAELMSLSAIAASTKKLAGDARTGSLSPDLMSGGSFTVSNLGSMGVESFTPVINPPQTAILGVCATTYRLRKDGTTYPAMGLSLTFDHRAFDGAPAAKFLKQLCTNLENFELLLAK